MNDFTEYIKSNPDQIYRFLIYRRMFTPYEMENKFIDDDEFIDSHYRFCKITNIFPVGDDFILELDLYSNDYSYDADGDCFECLSRDEHKMFKRLSEIELEIFDFDNRMEVINDE